MNDLQWSKTEKQAARKAFEAAYARECRAIRAKLVRMLKANDDVRQIWRIHDFLSEERRDTDRKYDYRYSVLVSVFARLLREGWLAETDLSGLGEDKIQQIKDEAAW